MITNGMVTRLAERVHALGLELVPHREGGWVLRVDSGVVFGPAPWAFVVQWVAETETERRAHEARLARVRARRERVRV